MATPGTFAVSPAGAATYSIPISVPPGTSGMVPALSLQYSSQNGDGIVGLGWALGGLPSITRCPRTLAQDNVHGSVNYDANDRFCMDGQRLMVVSGSYGANGSEYRTELESFTKVVSYGSSGSGPAWFKVWTKAGQIIEFGNSVDSQVKVVNTASGVTSANTVRVWAANRISDAVGNYLTVTYNCAPSSGACTDTDRTVNGEVYPLRADYTGNASAGVTPYNSVRFTYAARSDAVPLFQAGAITKLTKVLTNIKTYEGATLVMDYQLAYRAGTSVLRSHLTAVTQCNGASQCLPATTFGWQGLSYLALASTAPDPLPDLTDKQTIAGDWNGDGLTDLAVIPNPVHFVPNCPPYPVYFGNQTYGFGPSVGTYLTNGASSGFSSCYPMGPTQTILGPDGTSNTILTVLAYNMPPPLPPASDYYFINILSSSGNTNTAHYAFGSDHLYRPTFGGDFNGDGIIDFFAQQQPNQTASTAYVGTGDGTTFNSYRSFNLPPTNTNVAAADYDGDGCTDVKAVPFDAGGVNATYYFCNPAVASATAPTMSGYHVVTQGDFNGDGKTDLIFSKTGVNTELWLSTGTGFQLVNSSLPQGWVITAVGDWNGDGKADVIAHDPDETDYYFLSTGTGFTLALDSSGDPVASGQPSPADWNNDGATDAALQAITQYVPELMVSVSNGIGASTQIVYDRINKGSPFYTKGSGAVYPIQDMIGPQYVVKSVDRSDGLGTCAAPGGANCYRLNYAYAGAKKDLKGRGFLGFSQVKISDPQTGIVETTNTSTTFPYVGLITSQSRVHGAVTLSSTTNSYTNNSGCGITPAGSGVYVNCLTQSVVTANDLNGAAFPTTTTSYTYDNSGNPLTVNVSLTGGSYKNTTNTYWSDAANWFIGRLLTTTVNSMVSGSNLTRTSSFAYSPTTGLLIQEVIQPSTATCNSGGSSCTLTTDYTYDAFGHRVTTVVSGSGIATRTSRAGYDSLGRFQTTATNALGQSESWTYNPAFGLPASHTDLNALTTSWSYDGFGRPTLEVRPDGTRTLQSYGYCPNACPAYGQFYANTAVRAPDGTTQIGPGSTVYFDMLARTIASDTQGYDASTIRTATLYDTKGRVQKTSRPYFTAGASPAWTTFTYDDLGRVTLAAFPDTSQSSYGYNGLTTTVTNAKSQTTTTTRNAQGLTASVQDAAGNTTSYLYDAFGNVTRVTDPAGNMIQNSYDIRGHKIASRDPDMGAWTYTYDVLGNLTGQTDAKSQTTTLTYDLLNRPLTRTEQGLYSAWTYGTSAAARDVGQVIQAKACPTSACASTISTRTAIFDSLGRPVRTLLLTPEGYFGYGMAYNATNGQLASVTYPSGFTVSRSYNQRGYLSALAEAGGGPIWAANARNAEQQLTSQTAGNGVTTVQAFNPLTGLMQSQRAGSGGAVASFDYAFDAIGNLTSRTDNSQGYTERFCYDALNRLTNTNFGAACTGGKTVSYNAIGNITAKSDAGSYTYGIQPHAVASISGTVDGLSNPKYGYDPNGNMLCVSSGTGCSGTIARSVIPTSFNMTGAMIQGDNSLNLTYDDQHQRIRQVNTVLGTATTTTLYLNDSATGAMSERVNLAPTTPTKWNSFSWNAAPWGGTTANTMPTWTDYITVDGQIVAQRSVKYEQASAWGFQNWGSFTWGRPAGNTWGSFNWGAANWSGPAITWAYFSLDHLGSVAVIASQGGAVTQRLSYDAWGKQRNANGTDTACGNISPATTRGFTNQEQMPTKCLVNLNARIYDPSIGRFMAADSVVPDAFNGQSYNRFSYVRNGPLSFVDPTGNIDTVEVPGIRDSGPWNPGMSFSQGAVGMGAGAEFPGAQGASAPNQPMRPTATVSQQSQTNNNTKYRFNVSPPNTCSRAGGAGSNVCGGSYLVSILTITIVNSSGAATIAADNTNGEIRGVGAEIQYRTRPQLRVVNNMLVGTITVRCYEASECGRVIDQMRGINHKYREGYGIDLNITPASGRPPSADILVDTRGYDPLRNGEMQTDCKVNCPMNLYSDNERTPAHELGHYLGLGHSAIKGSVMGPDNNDRLPYPAPSEVKALINAYRRD